MKSLFIIISCLLGICCLGLSYFALCWLHRLGVRCGSFARRPAWIGIFLGTICLVWSAYHGSYMLEGDLSKYRTLVWMLVPVTILLSIFFLDYLNARALGGFFTLCANHLIAGAFAFDVPGRGFYSLVCLALGIVGMIGIGLPWRYRDALEIGSQDVRVRHLLSGVFLMAGLVFLLMPWFARL